MWCTDHYWGLKKKCPTKFDACLDLELDVTPVRNFVLKMFAVSCSKSDREVDQTQLDRLPLKQSNVDSSVVSNDGTSYESTFGKKNKKVEGREKAAASEWTDFWKIIEFLRTIRMDLWDGSSYSYHRLQDQYLILHTCWSGSARLERTVS